MGGRGKREERRREKEESGRWVFGKIFSSSRIISSGWRARWRSGKENAFLEQIFERLGLLGGYI
jgi:hypothetical protein